MKKNLLSILAGLLFGFVAIADSGKPVHHLIIDTDGALDDLRALTMLMADKDVTISAITCSQGTLSPASCIEKVNALKNAFYHEGIPLGTGRIMNVPLPPWNGFAESINWGYPSGTAEFPKAYDVITRVFENSGDKMIFIAMGPLTSFADWIKDNKEKTERIEKIIWYCDPLLNNSFNYMADTASYSIIINAGIPLDIVYKGKTALPCGNDYLKSIQKQGSLYASYLNKILSQQAVAAMLQKGHSQLWDDLLALYLAYPDLFTVTKLSGFNKVELKGTVSAAVVYNSIARLLLSKSEAMNRVFKTFPVNSTLYKNEYLVLFPSVPNLYGLTEWKAIVLTNEVHGHTGIYSIIGAKAGVRALEYFNAGVNDIEAVSFAGKKPPLSCFNDGIQISTGATIGQGLITVSDTVIQVPTIIFSHDGQKVRFTLKETVASQMKEDIKTGIRKFGMSAAYWEYVEELAKKYWKDYDRHEIFEIQKL